MVKCTRTNWKIKLSPYLLFLVVQIYHSGLGKGGIINSTWIMPESSRYVRLYFWKLLSLSADLSHLFVYVPMFTLVVDHGDINSRRGDEHEATGVRSVILEGSMIKQFGEETT